MSLDCQNLSLKILHEYFGDVVSKVGEILLRNKLSTLPFICSESKQPKSKVQESLCVLIKHNLVTWKRHKLQFKYDIFIDRIELLLRFPRYVLLIRELFGEVSEMVVDTITREGQITASQIIICSCLKLMEADSERGNGLEERHTTVKNELSNLIEKRFIMRCPDPDLEKKKDSTVKNHPEECSDDFFRFQLESIDLKLIQREILTKSSNSDESLILQASKTIFDHPDSNIFWRLNYDQFHLEFRDIEIRNSISRRIDPLAGACLGAVLKVAYKKSDPWMDTLNAVTVSEIRDQQNDVSHLEQYLRVIDENGGGCLRKIGDAGGGEYIVNIGNIIKAITLSTIENIIQERYGSKSARIFRLVQEKGRMEQDHIIKASMIENKEANLLLSQLLRDGFLELHELRKNLAPSNKSFFLYYVDAHVIVLSLIEWCYKALYNIMVQREMRYNQHKRLLDKKAREEILLEKLKQSGEATEEQIKDVEESLTPSERELVKNVWDLQDKLLDRETALDEMLFLLQTFTYFHVYK